MAADHPDLSFMLAPGDLIGHGYTISDYETLTDEEIEIRYAELMNVHRTVADMFQTYFGDIPVLPAFGNNDVKYHYQSMDKPFFYLQLYQRWFMWHDGNKKMDNLKEIQETMLDGGWYRANLIPE